MGRKEKPKAKATKHEEIGEVNDNLYGGSTPSLVFSSDDDEEANQDLSLKIVEKALRMRAGKLVPNDAVSNGDGGVVSPSQQPRFEVAQSDDVLEGPTGIDASEATEKKMKSIVESGDQSVIITEEQGMEETIKATENPESVEASMVQIGDNIVLRKLLRGPRYFDPPDSRWGACYNCGEEGHAAVNCTAAKRKKPCYVCGSLEHKSKECAKVQDCFICKKGGHRAKFCPEKHMSTSTRSLIICLKCGNSGHDMFSCKNDYSRDDLKEIQCYLCKTFGHLCCVNSDDATPGEISCYKCGRLGHTGLACSRVRGEITGAATPSSCYRCGEEGHFARECTNSIKAGKKNHESSNKKNKISHKENDHMGHRSAPHDVGNTHKMKRPPTEERGFTTPKKSKSRGGWMVEHPAEERGFTTTKKSKSRGGWMVEHPAEERGFKTPKKSKTRGGWMMEHPAEERDFRTPKKSKSKGGWTTEHPGDFSPSRSTRSSFRSPVTPSTRSTNFHSYGGGSSSKSSNMWKGQPGASKSQGSGKAFHHRFSASRFGNSSSDGHRSYNWW